MSRSHSPERDDRNLPERVAWKDMAGAGTGKKGEEEEEEEEGGENGDRASKRLGNDSASSLLIRPAPPGKCIFDHRLIPFRLSLLPALIVLFSWAL